MNDTGYVTIEDGQDTWVADRNVLITAMRRAGWSSDTYQGHLVAIEPLATNRIQSAAGDGYSDLCNAVGDIEGRDAAKSTDRMTYRADINGGTWVITRGLYDALAEADATA